jgi:hypothetical protein
MPLLRVWCPQARTDGKKQLRVGIGQSIRREALGQHIQSGDTVRLELLDDLEQTRDEADRGRRQH